MSNTDTQRRPGGSRLKTRVILTLVLCAAVLAALTAAFISGRTLGKREEAPPVITSDLLGEQLHTVQDLVTVEYFYTNMGKFENQIDFYGWKVPLTTKSFIVSYDGVIRAGVDLSGVRVTVDETARTVLVVLPGSRILSHEIPEDSIEVFDETKNIFNPITIEDYTTFTADQKAAVEQRALDNGLLTHADTKACTAVEAFLRLIPGMEAYQLTVRVRTA